MTAPVALIEHALTGRTRMRVKAMRGNPDYFATLEDNLARCAEVRRVRCDPRTAGVLLHHLPDSLSTIATTASENDWFDLRGSATAHSFALAPRITPPSPRLLLAGLFGGLAAIQTLRGDVMAPATSMFWYAATLLPAIDGDYPASDGAADGR